MWGFINDKDKELLQKTNESLAVTQKSNEILASAINGYLDTKENNMNKELKSGVDQLKAAYSLNLCTVSVSQIIDYNDIRFLESEYNAILNNLNLEEMPKDEALLCVLKKLLDVITFFRIQEEEREVLEQEYTHKVKDAIWSAIPSPSMIITSGKPLAIVGSLALQVGTGFMNYKREISKINLEKKRSDWELQRSAIEQFNGLRRELFDCSWRLAKEYNFPDEFRITENQITQYNNILLDPDDMRKYERLDYIKEKFKAYPPFWYYLGNAANAVSQLSNYGNDLKNEYKQKALSHYDYFLEITEQNLLREDQLIATCALEKFDLIEDRQERVALLEKAVKAAGTAFDVLQICAISYMKIGEIDKSCNLLRMLVNEGYNEKTNSQLLSRMYVSKFIEGDNTYVASYQSLCSRVRDNSSLFPMPTLLPDTEDERIALNSQFLALQQNNLLEIYSEIMYYKICDWNLKYDEIWNHDSNVNIEIDKFLNEVLDFIKDFLNEKVSNVFRESLKKAISHLKDNEIEFLELLKNKENREDYKDTFQTIFEAGLYRIAEHIKISVKGLDNMAEISCLETHLNKYVRHEVDSKTTVLAVSSYSFSVLGEDSTLQLELDLKIKRGLAILNLDSSWNTNLIPKSVSKAKFIKCDNDNFEISLRHIKSQLDKAKIPGYIYPSESSIIAIFDEKRIGGTDIIFTTEGIILTEWPRQRVSYSLYRYIRINDSKIEFDNTSISIKNLDLKSLKRLIDELKTVSPVNFDDTKVSLSLDVKRRILQGRQSNVDVLG